LSRERTQGADLVIIDEFGPAELSNRGWREAADSILAANGRLLLVVREELAADVARLYAKWRPRVLPACAPSSAQAVAELVSCDCSPGKG
jgi:nucleoside-triphosphatase THEP1